MMKLTKAQCAVAILSGVATLWVLNRVKDADSGSINAAFQRQWLVAGLLLAGGYVVFSWRRMDCESLRASCSQEAVEARCRKLGIVAGAFLVSGALIALRLIWWMGKK